MLRKALGVVVLVSLVVLFFPRPAGAQATFDFGLRGGVSMAKITWADEEESDPSGNLLQPMFGIFLAVNFNKFFTFQPEIYYLTNGGKWEETFEGYDYEWIDKLPSIHIPLLAKFHLMPDNSLKPILFAGPALDFILSAKEWFYEDGTLIYEDEFTDYIKKTNFSLVFGGGIEAALDKITLILDVRYVIGLTNLIKVPDPGETVKTKALMIVGGIGF